MSRKAVGKLKLYGFVTVDCAVKEHGREVPEPEEPQDPGNPQYMDLRTGRLYKKSRAYEQQERYARQLRCLKDEACLSAWLRGLQKQTGKGSRSSMYQQLPGIHARTLATVLHRVRP